MCFTHGNVVHCPAGVVHHLLQFAHPVQQSFVLALRLFFLQGKKSINQSSINQSSQSVTQSTNQPINQSTNQTKQSNKAAIQSIKSCCDQFIKQPSINQRIHYSTYSSHQSINQSINYSINQSINQSIDRSRRARPVPHRSRRATNRSNEERRQNPAWAIKGHYIQTMLKAQNNKGYGDFTRERASFQLTLTLFLLGKRSNSNFKWFVMAFSHWLIFIKSIPRGKKPDILPRNC